MHSSVASLIGVLALFQSLAIANPLPNPQNSFMASGDPCSSTFAGDPEYKITSQKRTTGKPIQVGDSCTPSKGQTCTLGRSVSYSVGVTVTTGVNLGVDFAKILKAGIDASVAISTTKGTTDSDSETCAGPWACSMTITPSVQEVSGTQRVFSNCPVQSSVVGPYTAQFPIMTGDHLPVQHGEVCQCRNFPGFDEHHPDAPKPCPDDC